MAPRPTPLRFAVATFPSWESVGDAARAIGFGVTDNGTGLAVAGPKPAGWPALNCLGLQRAFELGDPGVLFPARPVVPVQTLAFFSDGEPVCCTEGVLARCLAERVAAGAPSLKSALGHWLIPRHAAALTGAVAAGNLLLWVQLFDSESERRICRALLERSSPSVGVHDLICG